MDNVYRAERWLLWGIRGVLAGVAVILSASALDAYLRGAVEAVLARGAVPSWGFWAIIGAGGVLVVLAVWLFVAVVSLVVLGTSGDRGE